MRQDRPIPKDEIRLRRPEGLGGAEFVGATCGRRSFAKHFHEEFSVTIMVRGVERFRMAHRQSGLSIKLSLPGVKLRRVVTNVPASKA